MDRTLAEAPVSPEAVFNKATVEACMSSMLLDFCTVTESQLEASLVQKVNTANCFDKLHVSCFGKLYIDLVNHL